MVTFLGKYARGRSQDELEPLIVTRKICGLRIANCGLRVVTVDLVLCFHFCAQLLLKNKSAIRNPQSAILHSLTYSNSNGLPLIPAAGGAIQLAIFPTSVTCRIRLCTYSRSASVGNHSAFRR